MPEAESEEELMDHRAGSKATTARLREPLLGGAASEKPAPPSLLGTDPLSASQQRQDERIRTLCLVVLSVAVLGGAAYYLKAILIRFVLALALRYLLMPLIDVLSCAHVPSCRFRLNRALAILIALLIAAGVLCALGLVVAKSIGKFAANSELYAGRVERLVEAALNLTSSFDLGDVGGGAAAASGMNSTDAIKHTLSELAKNNLSLSDLILGLLGTAAHVVENIIYILLFLAFLLAGSRPRPRDGDGGGGALGGAAADAVHAEAEERIYRYIRGKVLISLLVALNHAAVLWAVGTRDGLWLVFAVLSFSLNFVPNVGMALAVVLPMPLIALDPRVGAGRILVAFLAPLGVGLVAKDVLEPLLIGEATSLTPVAVLLSVMIWGSVWGLTGMVLAVPLTAVIRIYLAGLEHPLPRYCALVLAGRSDDGGGAPPGTHRVAPL